MRRRLPIYVVCPVCGRVTSTDSGYCRHCRAPLFPYGLLETPREAYSYDVRVGVDREERGVGFRVGDLAKHLGVFGLTGFGKTNFVKVLLEGVVWRGVEVFVLDFEGEYGDLASLGGVRVVDALGGLGLEVFRRPVGVCVEEYSLWLSEVLAALYSDMYGEALSPPMRYVLGRAVRENVERGGGFGDLLELFRKYSSELPSRAVTYSALYTRFEFLASGYMSRILEGRPVLGGGSVVVDLSGVARASPGVAKFVAVMLLRVMFDSSRGFSRGLRRLVVLEEAEEVVGRGVRAASVLRFLLRARKRGLGLVLVSHSPSLIDGALLKGVSNVAVFRLSDVEDARVAASMLGLPYEQWRVISSLGMGEAVVRSFSSPAPFFVKVDRFGGGAAAASRLLESIVREPFLSVRARRSRLGLSSREYRAAEEALVSRGAVRPVYVVVGRGRPLKLYAVRGEGGEGVAHRYAVEYILGVAREVFGRDIFVEGGVADLYSEELGLCVEVETGSNVYPGKYEGLAGQCRRVVVVPVTREAASMLRRYPLGGVEVMYLYELAGLLRRLAGRGNGGSPEGQPGQG